MQLEIGRIAQVIAGFTFRKTIEPIENGRVFVLQAKNIQNNILDTTDELIAINNEPPRTSSYLRENDIVIVSRGINSTSFRSLVFKSSAENVIASSSIHIIRITDKTVDPEYLQMYLQSVKGQSQISQITAGAHIKTIPKSELEKMKVPIPSREEQQNLIALNTNIEHQENLYRKKIELEKNIISQIFYQIIN